MTEMTFVAFEREGMISDVGFQVGPLTLRTGQRLLWSGSQARQETYRQLREFLADLQSRGMVLTNPEYMETIIGEKPEESA